MLLDAKNTEEEASSRDKGKFLLSDLLERSDDNNNDDEGTVAKDNNCYGNGDSNINGNGNINRNGGGDRNTGAGGGSGKCLGFLSPSALTEAFGAMAKAKASSSTKLRKNRCW